MPMRGGEARRVRQARACVRKTRFGTEDEAKRAMRRIEADAEPGKGPFNVYNCKVCRGYHVGATPKNRNPDR